MDFVKESVVWYLVKGFFGSPHYIGLYLAVKGFYQTIAGD
jgi:hypothetical protein